MVAKSSKIVGVGTVALFSLFGGSCFADIGTETFMSELSLRPTVFNVANGLSFPKFDGAKGTLTKVTLALGGAMDTRLTYKAMESDSELYKLGTTVTLVVTHLGLTAPDVVMNSAMNWSYASPMVVPLSGTYDTGTLADTAATQTATYIDSGALSLFVGGESDIIDFAVRSFAVRDMTDSGGNNLITMTTNASASGTITYEYSYAAVPEATTLLLGLAGGMPLLMHRRRARAAKA